jgi:hypothetical protein
MGLQALWVGSLAAIALQIIFNGAFGGLAYSIMHVLPAVIICRVALGRSPHNKNAPYPGGYLVSWYAWLAIAALIIAFIVLNNSGYKLDNILENILEPIVSQNPKFNFEVLDTISSIFPGIMAISWIMMGLFNCYFAQKLLQKYSKNIRTFHVKSDGYFHQWWDIAMVAALMLSYVHFSQINLLAKNLVLIVCIPLYILGLNVIYRWVSRNKLSGLWLIFIIITSVIFIWPAVFIVSLGFVQPWLRYLKK